MASEKTSGQYDIFALPSAQDLQAELKDTLGETRAEILWDKIREECSIASEDYLSVEELQKIAAWCIELSGASKCFGFSLKLKVDTFLAMEKDEKYNPDRKNIRELLYDEKRLATIANLGLLENNKDSFLIQVVEEASTKLDLPISVVSILFNEVQYFTAHHGLDSSWMGEASATNVEWSFCQYVLDSNELFEVQDSREVPYLKESPLVTKDSVVCYLGAPLTLKNGITVGTLCVVDQESKSFDHEEKVKLLELASRITGHLNEKLTHVIEKKMSDLLH